MKDIKTIQSDPKFAQLCTLLCDFEEEYGTKVWHSNRWIVPNGVDLEKWNIVDEFYKPLEKWGLDLNHQVYSYGSSKEK